MAKKAFDALRALAIASQALGFIIIITLETLMGDNARPWQAVTLAAMVVCALSVALVRHYRANKARKMRDQWRHGDDE